MPDIQETQELRDLQEVANGQAPHLLSLLGIKYIHSGRWLSSPCVVHGGDNRHGFGWNLDKGYWKCFTQGCHEKHGSDMIGLVKGVLRCEFNEALDWLMNNVVEGKNIMAPVFDYKKIDRVYPEECLKKLLKTNYYLKKGFKQETVDAFEHGKAESKKMRGRIVFPIRDAKGFIRGFSGRWAGKETVDEAGKTICITDNGKIVPKWKHLINNKADYLYHFYRAKDYCEKEIILVESIGNVMKFWECGFKNCVACLGSSLTEPQAHLLIAHTNKIILAFDNDKAGHKARDKAKKRLEEYIDLRVLESPVGKDWAEISNEELLQIWATQSA